MVEKTSATSAGWITHLRGDPLPWLLEPTNPSARYLTLQHVLDRPEDNPAVAEARTGILEADPATVILAAQWPDGYWVTSDRGYTPRYRATLWQIAFLAQLGAPRDDRIERACAFAWEHSRRPDGLFTPHKHPELDDLANLNGNLLWAMARFEYAGDPRMRQGLDALAALNLSSLLEAGAVDAIVKLARGLLAQPPRLPSALHSFLEGAAAFLLRRLPLDADDRRLKFGFPVAEETDLLEMLHVLGEVHTVDDPRFTAALEIAISKQDRHGRWSLESVPRKMWASFGELGQPNKWVTLRALEVLKSAESKM